MMVGGGLDNMALSETGWVAVLSNGRLVLMNEDAGRPRVGRDRSSSRSRDIAQPSEGQVTPAPAAGGAAGGIAKMLGGWKRRFTS